MTDIERAALVMLAIAPAVVIPGALNRFVFGKLAVAALGILLAVAIAAPARGRLPRAVCVLLVAVGVLLLAAALAGPTPRAQLTGLPPRYEGAIALSVYLGALVAGARLLGVGRASGAMACFLRWTSFAAIAVGFVALLDALGVDVLPGSSVRFGSLLGNASDEGAWALLALGPLAAVALAGRRPLHVAAALATAAALVCSGSRGALVGALVLTAVLVVLAPTRRTALVTLGALAMVPAAALVLPDVRARVTSTSPLAARTVDGRLLLWHETGGLLLARPALGVGPSAYADAITSQHTVRYERAIGSDDPPDSPHDWLLQAAVAGGAGLALLAIALAGMTLAVGWRAIELQPTHGESVATAGMVAGLAGYAAALLFHFTSPGTTPLAAVFAGALLASHRHDRRHASVALGRAVRLVAGIAMTVLVVLLTAAALAELPLRTAVLDAAAGRLTQADRAFRTARARRPWDTGIAAIAAHAFATLAVDGIAGASAVGRPWSASDLAAHPHSMRALADAGALAASAGEPGQARVLLDRAVQLDPRNADLRERAEALLRWPGSR